ncbi:ankyrin repeat domain protein [Nitzschia inconspicua]|uniref:Ankyrin repeat domain protein n=1 Tax=Nitzschia inconspicua TaxID=303405 RepID=A0A9K3Q006_9STRA|nr:ankyrin repeat domain protein [Nitzschia inconspicua]
MNDQITGRDIADVADDDWLFEDITASGDVENAATLEEQSKTTDQSDECQVNPFDFCPMSPNRSLENLPPSSSSSRLATFDMPPQLHPAVSLGVRRVSSCYFSLASQESMKDLLSQLSDNGHIDEMEPQPESNCLGDDPSLDWIKNNAQDVFYHDVLMNVFNFLDAQSLKAFSETARRPNFEVFYYLQLQLQQALLVDNEADKTNDGQFDCTIRKQKSTQLSAVAGSAFVSRLARLDKDQAHKIVQTFLDSNSTLRTMPLSHSLAYARRYLIQNGFSKMFPNNNTEADKSSSNNNSNSNNRALASAALFMTVVGAASLMSTVSGSDASAIASSLESLGTELPNMLFRVGFVGSLMGAARQMSDTEQRIAIRETAEQMTRSMKQFPTALMRANPRDGNEHPSTNAHSQPHFRLPSLFQMKEQLQLTIRRLATEEQERNGFLWNPYDHLPQHRNHASDDQKNNGRNCQPAPVKGGEVTGNRKLPSGCVGAYAKAIKTSSDIVREIVKTARKAKFDAKPAEERQRLSLEFLNACSSNSTLDRVKEMIHCMDVDGFFTGVDGSETCPLHTAAFHGADRVVGYLCSGLDENDGHLDGGLCDKNIRDSNGWTALHFAAGANSISVARILANHGAELQVEAQNGYSPLQWAMRLSNEDVARELTKLVANEDRVQGAWVSSQPLTSLANRFFALIPTH